MGLICQSVLKSLFDISVLSVLALHISGLYKCFSFILTSHFPSGTLFLTELSKHCTLSLANMPENIEQRSF
jgi:hypothetical protein